MHSMCCCVRRVRPRHNAAHASRDRPDPMVNRVHREKMVHLVHPMDHRDHQDPMPRFAIDYYQYRRNVHAQQHPAQPVSPDSPEMMVHPEIKDRTVTMEHQDQWAKLDHQARPVHPEIQDNEARPANRVFSHQVHDHHQAHQANPADQDHRDHQDLPVQAARTAITVHQAKMVNQDNAVHRDKTDPQESRANKDKLERQAVATIVHRRVLHPDTRECDDHKYSIDAIIIISSTNCTTPGQVDDKLVVVYNDNKTFISRIECSCWQRPVVLVKYNLDTNIALLLSKHIYPSVEMN